MKEEITKGELIFIPLPGRGHLVAALQTANHLVSKHPDLSATVLIIKPIYDPTYIDETDTRDFNSRIRLIDVTEPAALSLPPGASPSTFFRHFIDGHKDEVRKTVAKIADDFEPGTKLAGFVVDMFCTTMIDVAHYFQIPTYVFFPSAASTLWLFLHFQGLRDYHGQDLKDYDNSICGIGEIELPLFSEPIPKKLLPRAILDGYVLDQARRYRETKGILINTFMELESNAINLLQKSDNTPPVYPIGPILYIQDENNGDLKFKETMDWLDSQPDSSVVFLCFGSKGTFDEVQVKLIATALERAGHRFLWSLRKPVTGRFETPMEYENPFEVLPEGFLERTFEIGKVIGWAPQAAVLGHRAVGGFVSHCGWNSTLESLWSGVPMATWPLYAEQQANAFLLVKELGVAVEIRMDYVKGPEGGNMMVSVEEIESGIRKLMDGESGLRKNMEKLKEKSRACVIEGGSSLEFMERFAENVMRNINID